MGWPWAWCACSSGGHQEALVRISTFLAETRFAVSQSVRIWTLVFWLCLSFPLEAWVRGTGWETPWAGSWMHGPLPGNVAQLPCLPKRGASAVATRSGRGPGWASSDRCLLAPYLSSPAAAARGLGPRSRHRTAGLGLFVKPWPSQGHLPSSGCPGIPMGHSVRDRAPLGCPSLTGEMRVVTSAH